MNPYRQRIRPMSYQIGRSSMNLPPITTGFYFGAALGNNRNRRLLHYHLCYGPVRVQLDSNQRLSINSRSNRPLRHQGKKNNAREKTRPELFRNFKSRCIRPLRHWRKILKVHVPYGRTRVNTNIKIFCHFFRLTGYVIMSMFTADLKTKGQSMQEATIAKGAKNFDKSTPIIHRQQKLDRMQYQSRFITLRLTKYGEALKLHYGSHANVARIMGITPGNIRKSVVAIASSPIRSKIL